jgi:hypothetical protein
MKCPALCLAVLAIALSSFAQKPKVAAVSPDSVSLTWTQSTGVPVTTPPATCPSGATVTNPQTVTGNTLYRSTTSGTEVSYVNFSTPTVSYVDTGNGTALVQGQTYFYKVSASNCNGPGGTSTEASATIPLPATPAAPTGLAITAVAQVSTNPPLWAVSLKWTAPAKYTNGVAIVGPVYYNVQRDVSGTVKYAKINASPLTCLTYFDATVAHGTSYDYTVTAWQGGRESVPSAKSGNVAP